GTLLKTDEPTASVPKNSILQRYRRPRTSSGPLFCTDFVLRGTVITETNKVPLTVLCWFRQCWRRAIQDRHETTSQKAVDGAFIVIKQHLSDPIQPTNPVSTKYR
ncbi:MAG: hypothetical protein ACRD1G_17190, partial [Acidimicrobiales bacterium]